VFTARYALSPYIKQIRFVFKGLTAPAHVMYFTKHNTYMFETRAILRHATMYNECDAMLVQQITKLAVRKIINNFKVNDNNLVEQQTQI
jgi:hypothetical protein